MSTMLRRFKYGFLLAAWRVRRKADHARRLLIRRERCWCCHGRGTVAYTAGDGYMWKCGRCDVQWFGRKGKEEKNEREIRRRHA